MLEDFIDPQGENTVYIILRIMLLIIKTKNKCLHSILITLNFVSLFYYHIARCKMFLVNISGGIFKLYFAIFSFCFLITDASILTAIAYCSHTAMAILSSLQVGKYSICLKRSIFNSFLLNKCFCLV